MKQTNPNRRSKTRFKAQKPALLHHDMVETLNVSADGARLLLKKSIQLRPRMPLMIQTGDNDYAAVICEPKWRRRIGRNLFVIGVSFAAGELYQLRQSLSALSA